MHFRYATGPLLALMLIGHVAAASPGAGGDAGASDAAFEEGGSAASPVSASDTAASEEAGAGGVATTPSGGTASGGRSGKGDDNAKLIDEYTDDHGCRCSTVGSRAHGATWGWLSGLALGVTLLARARRRA